ncbi:hypothetical protein L6164_026376 [Bauhinia variegata]|uniref:Uncharacterized protein n=1 Tax=Bauhinia variegata TaxID=167791 RepID=A0ACB9LQ42_BAUVA|nr:hypothetical protein L6164_026376 [Bauhinia variegata]
MKLFDNSDGPDISDDRIQSYLNEFKEDSAAVSIDLWKWDTGKETAELESGMRSYVTTKQENKLALKIKEIYKPKLKQELSRYVIQFLCEETDPTWSKMRKHYKSLINSEVSSLKVTFSELGVKEDDQEKKEESLNKYAEAVVKAEARKESNRAEEHMKKKFENLFMENSSSRDWDSDEAVKAAAINSLHIPLMLLAGLVAIRLEDSDAADNIQYILASAFLAEYKNALKDLESDTWAQIKSSKETLITPSQCKESWKRFVDDATRITNQFLGDLKTAVANSNSMIHTPARRPIGRWCKPATQRVKANVDASIYENGMGGTSGMFRDERGAFMATWESKHEHLGLVEVLEAIAVRE